ncbi:MAG: STAS domain-containing protein [Spirochaetaceae bacterium]|nr:STAS domain-containing protein [Spirochaetaceae bacterium]
MTTIELQGELGINNAAELKKIFISALEKKQPITFDVSKLEDIDVSIVQLLYALYSEMDSSCSISYIGMLSPLVKKRLFNIGVASSPTLSEQEIVNEIEAKLRVLHE